MTTAVIEAMATGLPIIATMHSGFPDQVIPGKNGYLAREADPEDLGAKMLAFIEHAELWSDMSRASREIALAKYDRKPLIAKQHELYQTLAPGVKKVAFIAGKFPTISEVWFINQIADLLERGVDVKIYALYAGSEEHVSERYFSAHMKERTVSLEMPKSIPIRVWLALPKIWRMARVNPRALLRALNVFRYGREALSLKLLYRSEPLLGLDADLVHCHFGNIANRYLVMREILGQTQPFLTSFYGFDISSVVQAKGKSYYDQLRASCKRFIVMSENMKERVSAIGFPLETLTVLPISVDVEGFESVVRVDDGDPVRAISVGRFVEKKGFDDLITALAVVKEKSPRPFHLTIVGGPKEKEEELRAQAKSCGVEEMITWKGYMKSQDVIELYRSQHLYIQASKTAKSGDME
jgi:colanic acid/amylovoran biosynthesis glycosyltransferase